MRYCFIITDAPLETDSPLTEKICDNCGECEICDIHPDEKCTNCGKCIEPDEKYAQILIEKIIMGDK